MFSVFTFVAQGTRRKWSTAQSCSGYFTIELSSFILQAGAPPWAPVPFSFLSIDVQSLPSSVIIGHKSFSTCVNCPICYYKKVPEVDEASKFLMFYISFLRKPFFKGKALFIASFPLHLLALLCLLNYTLSVEVMLPVPRKTSFWQSLSESFLLSTRTFKTF